MVSNADCGVFGYGTFDHLRFGIGLNDDTITESLSITESITTDFICTASESLSITETDATELGVDVTENMDFVEQLEFLYELTIDEILNIVETVGAGYDWKSSCIALTCTLDKPKSAKLNCKMRCN
jgi:hypothetical protein